MFDALVAGGGPAGASAAIVLARAGRRVLLVDATPPKPTRFKVGESLPPASRPLLRDLGLLDRLGPERHLRSAGTNSAWGSSRLQANDFVFDPNGHGWHLDRHRFDRSLRRVAEEAGAEVREGVDVRVDGRADGAWQVFLGGREGVVARTLVDATGRRASVARAMGARRRRRDRLVGLVGTVPADEGDLDARTLIEAAPGGWWYTALIPGGRRVVAFMTDADLVPAGARTAKGFAGALARTDFVAPLVADGTVAPQTEAAHSVHLDDPVGVGWLAVGDAAIAFDPLSSQGIMTAIYTGMVGAETLAAYLDGQDEALGAYRERLGPIAAAYERNRLYAYAGEPRWPSHPFWARRMMKLPSG